MSELISFTSAVSYSEKVFIDPDEVVAIERHVQMRDLSQYSRIILRNGYVFTVTGSPERVEREISKARSEKGGEG
jgi:hypothetical protein